MRGVGKTGLGGKKLGLGAFWGGLNGWVAFC